MLRTSAPLIGALGIKKIASQDHDGVLEMRLHLSLAFLFVAAAPAVSRASDPSSTYADIATRSACVENLKGLGSTAIIFDALSKDAKAGNSNPNEEYSWDAQLVTTSGQIVRVQLHCAGIKSPLQQDEGIAGPSRSYVSELARL